MTLCVIITLVHSGGYVDVLDLLVQSEDKALNLLVKYLSLNPKFLTYRSNLKLNFWIYRSSLKLKSPVALLGWRPGL